MESKDDRCEWTYFTRSRPFYALLIAMTVVLGLASRRYGSFLPAILHKNAGDILWATMVYFLFAFLASAAPAATVAIASAIFSLLIELFKLYHNPSLDAFRKTTISKLIFGSVFSWSNIACYAIGILLGIAVERFILVNSKERPDKTTG